jgi:hypothetical protein
MSAMKQHYMDKYFNDGYSFGFNFEPFSIPEHIPASFRSVWEDGYQRGLVDASERVDAYMTYMEAMG